MMRRCLFSFCPWSVFLPLILAGAFVCSICRAQVVINEVYYDHPGADGGWEFVELYNAGEAAYDLTGFALEFLDGSSDRTSIVWSAVPGLSIEAGAHLCIAGSMRTPPPGLLLRGALGNGPDAVRLVSQGRTLDLVGYGELEFPDLYESSPAVDVEPGFSIARRPDGSDSNRNGTDFVEAIPSPGTRNFFSQDLALTLGTGELLPCRCSPFSLTVKLTNRGIDPFGGRVSITAEASAEGHPLSSDRIELDCSIAVAGVDSVRLSLVSSCGPRLKIRSSLSSARDENPRNDTVGVVIATSPGDVVINEVMYRPREERSEWIELSGNGQEPCNIGSWTLCDATGKKHLITGDDLWLPSGGFLILAGDSAAFADEYPSCPAPVRRLAGGWPPLNDVDRGTFADRIELFDSMGILVERVAYKDLLGDERARSIERVSGSVCSSLPGGVWHRSSARCGSTPGIENSMHSDAVPQGESIHVSPNPFCPKTGRDAVISGRLDEGETGFLVRIFTMEGAEVRRLFGENGGAPFFSCRWDGRANNGSSVRTGLYVCLVEYVKTGGGVCRREKKCIAVAAD